jgi:SAM-dependent methyltransferase
MFGDLRFGNRGHKGKFMPEQLPFETLLSRASNNPLALVRLASVLFNIGDQQRARELALKALKSAPDAMEIRSIAHDILGHGVPRWHFSIVKDEARNAAYDAAIRRAVTKQKKVLDVGTGSGLLAMMAARAGAKDVIACDMVPAIAEAAREIVAINGLADCVRVLAKKSYDLDVRIDMDGPADLMVAEIVNNTLLGEDALPVAEHAVRYLLKPGAKVIPALGMVRIALGHDDMFDRARMDTICGFDLSPFNRLAENSYDISRGQTRLTLLSEPTTLFAFDFQSGSPHPAETTSTTLTSMGGRANGIAQWIALKLDEDGWYENAPAPGASSAWAVMFWPFVSPRDYPARTTVEVFGRHNRHDLQIWA